ncbi:Trans,polycis-polyprenyl diphosphate synthase ((2Z,6E)-farnesyl diphosphate specific) [Streptomyces sp. enrichment culture]|uniref:polyprenyl diphosphate synthase n=1 Tax=Streptomyces sp. enrichment culture TaxID=1795815 RepID=UPI003F55F805
MNATAPHTDSPPRIPAGLLPRRVAVAMDGNGRWARERGLPRSEGHRAGAGRLPELARAALEVGVEQVLVYGFSTENWRRSPQEVSALMRLAGQALGAQRAELHAMGVRVRWSGRPGRLWKGVVRELRAIEELTRDNERLTLDLCVNYGGQAELVDAVAAIARQVGAGTLHPEAVDEATVARHLYQGDSGDVELFLRPSGERRTSNFLPWQLAHAELVFMEVLWPDFERRHLWEAVQIYADRHKRRGG